MSLPIRVMLVDDSAVVRGMLQRALEDDAEIKVVATAMNGEIALSALKQTPVDVIILDVEMPVMDGLTVLPELFKLAPHVKVIMSSSVTLKGAEVSMRAMALGASDCVAKPSARQPEGALEFHRHLIAKIHALVGSEAKASPAPAPVKEMLALPEAIARPKQPARALIQAPPSQALAIASSTGGPQALLEVFKGLVGLPVSVPIFITQHMPPNFTTILAQHLTKASGRDCHEAVDGEVVRGGVIYLAPGDYHMTVQRDGALVRLKLDKNPPENFCRPSADPMLRSLVKIYGSKLLVAVLTGIGSDGARGAVEVVSAGGVVIAQDAATSVVYGMPRAVADAQLTSAVLPLVHIAPFLAGGIA